jgi:hypothetical protein
MFTLLWPVHWEVLPFGEDYFVCDFQHNCILPMYGVVFKSMQVLLPFTTMELAVLRCLRIAPSQIHLSSWALMKAFQFWCQAKKSGESGPLFFNLFHVSFF